MRFLASVAASLLLVSCASLPSPAPDAIRPVSATSPVADDADDPAVWINRANPDRSLILGTNKVAAPGGALYVFGMDGAVRQIVQPLDRPNNVDVEYGLATPGGPIDIAVVTERRQHRLRVFRVTGNGVTAIDEGGIPILAGEQGEAAEPMGVALYRRPRDGATFAIVAPKTGGATNYLWQYRLEADSSGTIRGSLARRFGNYSGSGEIEAVAVDDALGHVYFSDEEFGVRKWHADPDAAGADTELAVFGRTGFKQQREGIAILAHADGTGYLVVSDQIAGGTELRVFKREGQPGRPHEHDPVSAVVPTVADSTDGLELLPAGINTRLPDGAVIMMNSRERNFQLYDWKRIAAPAAMAQTPLPRKRLIAHRGASAYAPEHTVAAYRLAIEQGAHYVEQDLAVTKDGILVCLHDDTLERTTNVAELFPDRAVVDPATGRKQWLVVDFTLAELKRLDAGSWFDPRFAGERIPTWEEAVALVGTSAGLYPELKSPPLYRSRGIDMPALFVESIRRLGLAAAPASRLIVQSFDPQALKDVTRMEPRLERTFLIDPRQAERWFTADGMKEIATFATDLGPSKLILDRRPELVTLAHTAGLTVTPYTFTTRSPGRIADVTEEMRYFLQDLKVDAVFTDNPDRFPR